MSSLKVAIAVMGLSDSGKTTAIDMARNELINRGFKVIHRENRPKNHEDERCVIVIDVNGKSIVVVICPPGDDVDAVKKNFDLAVKYDGVILVYAQHSGPKMLQAVSEKQKDMNCWLVIKYKEQVPKADEKSANKKFADELVDQILKLAGNIGNLTVLPY